MAGLDNNVRLNRLELELIQSHMAQKPVLRGEVGLWRDRSACRGGQTLVLRAWWAPWTNKSESALRSVIFDRPLLGLLRSLIVDIAAFFCRPNGWLRPWKTFEAA